MGSGVSKAPFGSVEEALAAGKTQEEIDLYLKEQQMSMETTPQLTLCYLKMQALAEPAQMMLHYAKIPYTYHYIFDYLKKPWAECKPLVPFGQAPVLIVNGDNANMIGESGCICRYIASLRPAVFKLNDLVQNARCDALFDRCNNTLFAPMNPCANFFVAEMHTNTIAKFMETWPGVLNQFTKQLELGPGPFFMGAEPKYCDFAIYHHFANIRLCKSDALDGSPSVVKFMEAFENLPGIKEYFAMRPTLTGIGEKPMLVYPDGKEMSPGMKTEGEDPELYKRVYTFGQNL